MSKVEAGAVECIPGAYDLTEGAVFTEASGRAVLRGGACESCGIEFFPCYPVCPSCMSEDVSKKPMPTRGTLYAFTRLHVGPPKWRKPLTLGYVDLENGVRVFTHLQGQEFSFGQAVELAVGVVGANPDGTPISTFVFRPMES